jgi:hypothetical protein
VSTMARRAMTRNADVPVGQPPLNMLDQWGLRTYDAGYRAPRPRRPVRCPRRRSVAMAESIGSVYRVEVKRFPRA